MPLWNEVSAGARKTQREQKRRREGYREKWYTKQPSQENGDANDYSNRSSTWRIKVLMYAGNPAGSQMLCSKERSDLLEQGRKRRAHTKTLFHFSDFLLLCELFPCCLQSWCWHCRPIFGNTFSFRLFSNDDDEGARVLCGPSVMEHECVVRENGGDGDFKW